MSLRSPYTTQIGRGAYSVIVFEDGDFVVAEDDVGSIIAEGTNAATVINAGVQSLPFRGGKVILKDKFTINTTITLDSEGIIFMGDSWNDSGLLTTLDIPLITVTTEAVKLIIEKMWLEGANDVAKTSNHGVFFAGFEGAPKYDMQLRDLLIHRTYDGINGGGIAFLNLDNVRCIKSKHDGIKVWGDASGYTGFYATNIYLNEYCHNGLDLDYVMGSKIVNIWLEGGNSGQRGLYSNHGYMNWFTNVDCENHTSNGMEFVNDVFGSVITGAWIAGNDDNGLVAAASQQLTASQVFFRENSHMGAYFINCDRMAIENCYAITNGTTGVGSYSGIVFENVINSIVLGSHAYDEWETIKQKYGIEEKGTSDYNRYTNNNLRGNKYFGIHTVGAHNSYDLHIKSAILDLSAAASDVELFHAITPCTLVGYQILYTEASSADAGVNVRIGRYQSGVALDNDYFDVSTSEVSKNKGYAKFFKTADLTQKTIAVGDTVTAGTAGGKTGTGKVFVVLMIAEMSD